MKHEGQKSFPNIAMRFIQGFLAIMPIIKGYDKILYTGAAIALLLFISSIIMTVLIFREKNGIHFLIYMEIELVILQTSLYQ